MLVNLSLEEMDYVLDRLKDGNPNPIHKSVAFKLAIALLDAPSEEHIEYIKNAQKTAAPDPD